MRPCLRFVATYRWRAHFSLVKAGEVSHVAQRSSVLKTYVTRLLCFEVLQYLISYPSVCRCIASHDNIHAATAPCRGGFSSLRQLFYGGEGATCYPLNGRLALLYLRVAWALAYRLLNDIIPIFNTAVSSVSLLCLLPSYTCREKVS